MIQLLTVSDMRESDRQTIATKTPSKELMYRAGEAIYDCVKDLQPPFAIVCGNGNNAGDGYVLAALLKKANIQCELYRITDRFSEDGKYYYDKCLELGVRDGLSGPLSDYNTIVDCIFGTGFHGEVKEPERSVIEAINSSGAHIVSVDINSGLNGDSGLCDICVHSNLTISIGNPKPGHYLSMAKDVCDRLINCDIGIEPVKNCSKIYLIQADDLKDIFADRPNNSNKGTYGYIGLIGGSQCYSGAIRLAHMAASAMRSGAGVVKVAAPASLGSIIMPAILESTFYPLSASDENLVFVEKEFEKLLNLSAIAFGMGIGNTKETEKSLIYLLTNYQGTLIIDADGLNALASLDDSLLANATCRVIITPHPKEFSRLTGVDVKEILCKPLYYALEYAKLNKITVLLKGTSSIITDGEVSLIVNRGCAGMATAGSGDVLSGIMAAVAGYNKHNPLLAAAGSAYIAGLAGELACEEYGDISLIASDTARYLPRAIKQIKFTV